MFKKFLRGSGADQEGRYVYTNFRNGMLTDTEVEHWDSFGLEEALTAESGEFLDRVNRIRIRAAAAAAADWRTDPERLTRLGLLDLFLVLQFVQATSQIHEPANGPTSAVVRIRRGDIDHCLQMAPSADEDPIRAHEMRRQLLVELIGLLRTELMMDYSATIKENAGSLPRATVVRQLVEQWELAKRNENDEWLMRSIVQPDSDLKEHVRRFIADWTTWEAKGKCGDATCPLCA